MMVDGDPLAVRGFNAEGLRRRGFSPRRMAAVKRMQKILYREGLTFEEARSRIAALADRLAEAAADVQLMTAFLADATRGIAADRFISGTINPEAPRFAMVRARPRATSRRPALRGLSRRSPALVAEGIGGPRIGEQGF